MPGKESWGTGDLKDWGHPDHSSVEISQNTEKSLGELMTLISTGIKTYKSKIQIIGFIVIQLFVCILPQNKDTSEAI